jgi:hypothetical protein
MADVPAITRRTIAAANAVSRSDIDEPQRPGAQIRSKAVIL